MNDSNEPTTTQLRDYYAALTALQEEEQTLLAEAHATDPTPLIDRFLHSVSTAGRRVVDPSEGFHESGRVDPPDPPTPFDELVKTLHFASHLVGRETEVADDPRLSFAYVDREIFPGRTRGKARMQKRTLDLLLVNLKDRTPIVGELKIRNDSLTYFALVQALMHVAELVSDLQRDRLSGHYPNARFGTVGDSPAIDLYVIAFEAADRGAYRERSFNAARRIAAAFAESADASRFLRRIAFLKAVPQEDALEFSSVLLAG